VAGGITGVVVAGGIPGVVVAVALRSPLEFRGSVPFVDTLVALVITGAAKVLVPLAAEVASDSGAAEASTMTAVAKGTSCLSTRPAPPPEGTTISGSPPIPEFCPLFFPSFLIVISAQLNSPLSNRLVYAVSLSLLIMRDTV
jgi:hypothetical protein